MLTHEDHYNLWLLSKGFSPAWSLQSFDRSHNLGMIEQDGRLSPLGKMMVARLLDGIAMLRNGVPLDRRIADRSDDATKGPFFLSKFREKPIVFNEHMVLTGKRHVRDLKPTLCDYRLEQHVRVEVAGFMRASDWIKCEPYAVQIDAFSGHEVVCMRQKGHRTVARIQTKYFDYVTKLYPNNLTWWQSTLHRGKTLPVGARIEKSSAPAWPFVAFVMPVRGCAEWPVPGVIA